MAGVGTSFIEPIIYNRVGYKMGYFIIWLTTSSSAVLMWVAVLHKDTFKHCVIISAIQFFLSNGEIMGTSRLTAILVDKFPERHAAKIVGVGLGCSAMANLIYGVLLQDVLTGDLQSFFLVSAVGQMVLLGSSFIIHGVHNGRTFSEKQYAVVTEEETTFHKNVLQSDKHSLSTMLKSPYFHGTMWPVVLTYGIVISLINNITSIAKSLGMDPPMNLVYVLSITITLGRITSGIVFDKLNKTMLCCFLFLFVGGLSTGLGLVILILPINTEYLYLATFAFGVALSVGFNIPCSRLAAVFGQHNIPYIFGFFSIFSAFFSLVYQYLIGVLYDRSLPHTGFCFGSSCFFLSNVIFLISTFIFLCLHIINYIVHNKIQSFI